MSTEPVPTGISAEDWAATPPSVRLWVETLLHRVAALEERVNQNSHNSSKPPSADPPNAPPRPAHPPSGRHVGAPPGHPGHHRPLKAVAHVQRMVEVKPTTGGACGALLLGEDLQPQRQQVTELPRME